MQGNFRHKHPWKAQRATFTWSCVMEDLSDGSSKTKIYSTTFSRFYPPSQSRNAQSSLYLHIRLLRLAPPVKLNQGYLQGYLSRNEPTNIIVQKPTSLEQACGKLPSYTRTISSKHGVTAKLSTPARQRHF
ncbi:hypothetical protein BDDG_08013 [Blastomyces dermatitidis ATCC 18188]|uniref:Uncharacterized protein n=1 Tax=Ajellomyces dermatitidis (strain ATCC 18188 / CBS 674.68) TaxID=653446 RepID=F2TPA5_AJEDA|nr:hypothetical protein BDDG_08013 [Blastomyces dermatitidis ATCC 18188]EQL33794.1 hypothetical protein BDFG_04320 [Blastomyces dermatitidis ATCC 26199]